MDIKITGYLKHAKRVCFLAGIWNLKMVYCYSIRCSKHLKAGTLFTALLFIT